jgi:uncharacterized protein (DUF427 family)
VPRPSTRRADGRRRGGPVLWKAPVSTTEAQKTKHEIRVEQGAKRVRAYLGGELVVDSIRPLLVWESAHYPTYYFPAEDVRGELLRDDGERAHSPSRGDGARLTVAAGGRLSPGGAVRYENDAIEPLRGTIRLQWQAMDAWFEEDEEVYTHARSPYTRIDILASSRNVRVEVDGLILAESSSPRLLFETGLMVRYYMPKPHVRMDLLQLTDRVTHCPYKGSAESWSLRAGDQVLENIAWSYAAPLPESQKIAGLIAFYNEKVDLFIDGVLQERPSSRFA